MISTATEQNASQIHNITARAGVFSQEEIDSVPEMFIKHGKESVQRQVESTDEGIDRLVYELYGLTEEEIQIVEGREISS